MTTASTRAIDPMATASKRVKRAYHETEQRKAEKNEAKLQAISEREQRLHRDFSRKEYMRRARDQAQEKIGDAGPILDWYETLGVEPKASQSMIKRRYLRLAMVLHPDRQGRSPEKAGIVCTTCFQRSPVCKTSGLLQND